MRKNAFVGVFLLVFVAGCGMQPELARRYRDARWGRTSEHLVSVSAFTLNAPPDKPKDFLLQMSPAAQTAFINQIGEKTKGKPPGEFLKLLTATLPRVRSHIAWDKTVFRKRVVFSVEKNSVLRGANPPCALQTA